MIISGETLESGADARRPRPKAKGVYIYEYMTEPEFVEGNAADALLYKVSYGFSSLSDIPNPNISDIAEG